MSAKLSWLKTTEVGAEYASILALPLTESPDAELHPTFGPGDGWEL